MRRYAVSMAYGVGTAAVFLALACGAGSPWRLALPVACGCGVLAGLISAVMDRAGR